MTPSKRTPDLNERFRRQLAGVLDDWVTEGLIEPEQRDRLSQFYQLQTLNRSASGRFALVLLLFGAVLVGLGVISFVAANWAEIPRSVRALSCLGVMVGLQVSGFHLWRQGSRRLGSMLLLAGELSFGACIGLMAQWMQVGGSPAGLFLAWGLGVLAMAYGLRHSPSGVLALILLSVAALTDIEGWGPGLGLYQTPLYPWLVIGVMLPLAYWCCSRWIFAVAVLNFALALQLLVTGSASFWSVLDIEEFTLVHLLGIAAVWGLGLWHQRQLPWLQQVLLRDASSDSEPGALEDLQQGLDLAPTAQLLASLGLGFLLYGWSFRFAWVDYRSAEPLWPYIGPYIGEYPWTMLSGAGLLLLTLWGWWQGWQRMRSQPFSTWLKDAVVFGCLLSLALLLLVTSGITTDSTVGLALAFFGPWLATLLLLGFSAVLCWEGLQQGQRGRFWQGLLGLTLVALTRFFEYDTGLLLKSVALVSSGLGVILIGLQFERRLAIRRE
ncbi:MAG: DUF2157 domain-containing protein [Thermostichus sp. BF3_bins_97]